MSQLLWIILRPLCQQFPLGITFCQSTTAANKNCPRRGPLLLNWGTKTGLKWDLISTVCFLSFLLKSGFRFSICVVFSVWMFYSDKNRIHIWSPGAMKPSEGNKNKFHEWGSEYLNALQHAELKALFPVCLERSDSYYQIIRETQQLPHSTHRYFRCLRVISLFMYFNFIHWRRHTCG